MQGKDIATRSSGQVVTGEYTMKLLVNKQVALIKFAVGVIENFLGKLRW